MEGKLDNLQLGVLFRQFQEIVSKAEEGELPFQETVYRFANFLSNEKLIDPGREVVVDYNLTVDRLVADKKVFFFDTNGQPLQQPIFKFCEREGIKRVKMFPAMALTAKDLPAKIFRETELIEAIQFFETNKETFRELSDPIFGRRIIITGSRCDWRGRSGTFGHSLSWDTSGSLVKLVPVSLINFSEKDYLLYAERCE